MAEFPNHTLDFKTLLRMHSRNCTYAMYQEDLTGSIEMGKRADLVVLDRNLFKVPTADMARTKVLMTMVDGKLVFLRTPTRRGGSGLSPE